MKKTFKKALSVLLVAVMVFGSAPLAGFVGIELPAFNLFGTKADAATSGYFTYLVSNNRATITDVSTSISGSVTIPATLGGYPVTSIGNWAFYNCTGLTSVTIGDGVTSIGDYAFYDCTGLTSVTIGDGVTSIGYYAFYDCTGLTSVTIGDGVTSIGNSAFSGCTRLKSVTIPDSVSSIGNWAFYNCTGLTSVTIGDGVTSIGDYAFYDCTGLTSVTIGDGVTSIGYYAFYDCTGLTSVTIGDGVTSIGNSAFYGCTGLTSVTIPDSVTSIGEDAFYKCTGLTSVTIGDGVTSIGDYAFYKCTGLTSVTIPDSVTSIGKGAFSGCIGLTSITIPDSVTIISDYAFYRCTGLTSITVDENNPNYSSDEYGVLFNKDKTELIQYPIGNERTEYIIPNSVTRIGSNAFEYCDGLTNVTIPDSVTSIGSDAFNNCTGLTSVTIPDSVTSIGYEAFYGCTGLTSITIPDSVTSIGSSAFSGCTGLTSVTIGDGVTSIGDYAFYDCTGLTSVTIGDGVTSIGDYAFYDCTGLTSVTIGDGVTSIGDTAFSGCTGLTSITIPDSVTSIGSSAFSGCTGLTSITIPDSVTSIGNYAFYYCKGLTSITIPDSVTSIGDSMFYGCTGLTSVTIPDSVTSIGEDAFYKCTGLTSITIPDSVTSIGDHAFYNTGIYKDSSNWENGVLYIGNYLIDADRTISGKYLIKPGIKVLADYAFSWRTGLTSITIPDSVTSIGDSAFSDCAGLTSVTIGNSVTRIGSYAFDGCDDLSTTYYVGTPKQWSHISIGSFNDPINRNIIFECNSERPYYQGTCGKSLTWTLYTDGELVIDGTGDMTDYSLSSNAPWYSKRSKIKSATIGNGITSIGDNAFYNCIGLTSITIPDSVTSIGSYAFDDCNNLSTTYYVGTPEQWGNISIGSYNSAISKNIVFECNSESPNYGKGFCGDNLTWTLYTDGELVIEGTGDMTDYSGGSNVPWYSKRSKIKSATIPDSVTSIGDYAFYGCTNLEKIEISAYSVEIADNAFDNSPKVIFYCKSGSTVQSYAELNDIMYILIDGPASGFAVKNNQLVAYKGESENPQLPSGVTSIGSNAFKDNSTVKTVELPNSVSSIFSGAFSNCSSLERIVVPHTVTTIAPDAFSGTNATIVCYANSYAHQYAVEKGMKFELISVTLNQTKVILSVGEYSIITATPEQEYLDSVQTLWKSSDTGVATVDANGKVTARSNGTATIYALAPTGEALATCSVQVGYSFGVTIQNPSSKTVSYKSGIILHATADNLPAGAKIVWEKDNDNFSISDDGNGNCTIVSKANGSTTFTAKVKLADGSIAKDSNGNEISAQVTMNSKAGFFDKIVAFFKGLFGGNKILPQLFKGIF